MSAARPRIVLPRTALAGVRLPALVLLALALVLAAPLASAADHTVIVRDFEFDPDVLTIQKGDTVIWQWESGSHTTTSGTGSGDPQSGDLWNSPISSSATTFQVTFNDTGAFPYYCMPHELANMVGTITVEEGTPAETVTWGRIKKVFENTRGTVGGIR